MSDKDFQLAIKQIREETKSALKSKATATHFLIKAGIITPKGNLRKPYR